MIAEESSIQMRGYLFYRTFASFAITCWILTALADAAYWATDSFLWETASVWLLAIGIIGSVIAIFAGLVDLVRSRRVFGLGQPWPVVLAQTIAFGLSIVNVFVHSRDGYTAVVPEGLALSCLVVLVLLVTTVMDRARAARTPIGGLA